jgi:site-specific recombinase XerD
MTEREILVNDLLQRLSSDGFDSKQLNTVKQNFYIVLDRYEIKEKRQTTELANVDELNNIIGLYCMSKKIEGVKEGSIKQYIRTVKLFFDYTHKDIHSVTSDDVRLWLYSLQKTNSNTSINNQRVYLSSFFQWC